MSAHSSPPGALSLAPNLMVDDMARTIAFYTDLLGFESSMHVPEEPPYEWVMLRRNQVVIMLQTRESMGAEFDGMYDKPVGGTFTLYLKWQGLRQLFEERLRTHSALVTELERTFYGNWECCLRDPSGYLLVLAEEDD